MAKIEIPTSKTYPCRFCGRTFAVTGEYSDTSEFVLVNLDGHIQFICTDCAVTYKWTTPAAKKRKLEKEQETEVKEEDKIYITQQDYNRYSFCRDNTICKWMYKWFGDK
jgi:hypothetical protein